MDETYPRWGLVQSLLGLIAIAACDGGAAGSDARVDVRVDANSAPPYEALNIERVGHVDLDTDSNLGLAVAGRRVLACKSASACPEVPTADRSAGSPGVEPERVKELELGLDGNAFDNSLTWELTYFDRNTTNLLLQRVPAPSTGFTSQIFNGGKIANKGIELGVGYSPIMNNRVQWITRGTFTRYRSEVLDLAGLPPFRPPLSGFAPVRRDEVHAHHGQLNAPTGPTRPPPSAPAWSTTARPPMSIS